MDDGINKKTKTTQRFRFYRFLFYVFHFPCSIFHNPISKQAKLIEERTGAKVKQYGQMFKLNPEVSDIAEKYAYNTNNISLLILGAVDKGGSGCA